MHNEREDVRTHELAGTLPPDVVPVRPVCKHMVSSAAFLTCEGLKMHLAEMRIHKQLGGFFSCSQFKHTLVMI